MVFGALVRGPLIGTPLINAGEDIAILTTGSPVVNPSTGKGPHQTGYDPLASTWEALTETPVTSQIVEVTAEVTQTVADVADEVLDAAKEILDFFEDVGRKLGKIVGDGLGAFDWALSHPLLILIGVVVVVGGVAYIVK